MSLPRAREPIFRVPMVVVALFAAMALVQIGQSFLTQTATVEFLRLFAFAPANWSAAIDPEAVRTTIDQLPTFDRDSALFLAGGGLRFWTILTYAFVHAGWAHLLANSIWFAAFGSPVARRLGAFRFLVLFIVSSVGGALLHWATHLQDFEPVVGASAGVSGVMAAAARFVFQPGGPIGAPASDGRVETRALGVRACFVEPRALAFIIMWFLANLVIGVLAQPLGISAAPIAWQAHIGGFFAGLFVFSALDPDTPHAELAPPPPIWPDETRDSV